MNEAPISVVILAKNEEKRIQDCIKSILGWADEIIVVDDESSDRTKELAQRLGARALIRKMDIEGRQRNWAYSQAKNEWVFSLDADERLTEELKKEIKEVLADTEHACFEMPFKTYIENYWIKGGGWYPGSKVRLFRKSKFKYEEVEVHPGITVDGSCGRLRGDIIHYNYRNWEDFLNKTNKQTTLEALKWHKLSLKNPKKARYKMNLSNVLHRA
ncbi:unnamed protein product [marine sediment metagenome]|uniref:Glycosyltransferase 2-like domain-containing protein n=1 Tax=marine sediment metagenome TaxID=412755 RepID=X1G5F7_9ZZZZ